MDKLTSPKKALLGALTSLLLVAGLAGCGQGTTGNSQADGTAKTGGSISGISASGEPGKKPTLKFAKTISLADKAHKTLIEGTGAALKKGDQVCTQTIAYPVGKGNVIDRSKGQDTWSQGTSDCSIVLSDTFEKSNPDIAKALLGVKVGSTIAFSEANSNTDSQQGLSKADTPYLLYVITVISAKNVPQRASGIKVSNIPANLPKVSLAANGRPSIDLSNFKDPNPGKLTTQVLIKGNGAPVKATDSVTVQYAGWLGTKDGHEFDSSWSRGTPATFGLDQVVKGWTQGLTGQTVGSQVLLIIPPSLGYGDQANSGIPANSTLIFVVDILAVA